MTCLFEGRRHVSSTSNHNGSATDSRGRLQPPSPGDGQHAPASIPGGRGKLREGVAPMLPYEVRMFSD